MGNERYDKEVRQIGGMMLICSLAVLVFPIYDTTMRISMPIASDPLYNDNENDIVNWVLLGGDLAVVALGLLGIFIGFLSITDGGGVCLTLIGILFEQTVFVDWIGKMYNLSLTTYSNYEDDSDALFFMCMGIIKMISLCFLLYGSLGLCLFNLFAFQTGKGYKQNKGYFKCRLLLYSFFYTVHGLVPFLIQGSKVYLDNKDALVDQRLPNPQPVVGQPISYPAMTIAMGCLFTIVGLWGMARGLCLGGSSRLFQATVMFTYLAYMGSIVLTEFSINNASGMASMATVVAINGHVILMYLDHKASTMPEFIDADYYDGDSTTPSAAAKAEQEEVADESEYEEEEIEAEGMA